MKKAVFCIFLALICLLGCLYLKDRFVPNSPQRTNSVTVNPPIKKKNDTQITHTVIIPKDVHTVDTPIRVKDVITSPDSKVNNGVAEVIPNEDGTITVVIEESIRVEPVDKDLKLVLSPDSVGIAYELLEVYKFNLDAIVTTKDVGIGLSYDIYNNTSLGISRNISYHGEVSTKLYVSVVF